MKGVKVGRITFLIAFHFITSYEKNSFHLFLYKFRFDSRYFTLFQLKFVDDKWMRRLEIHKRIGEVPNISHRNQNQGASPVVSCGKTPQKQSNCHTITLLLFFVHCCDQCTMLLGTYYSRRILVFQTTIHDMTADWRRATVFTTFGSYFEIKSFQSVSNA